jgi:hypothetical protein
VAFPAIKSPERVGHLNQSYALPIASPTTMNVKNSPARIVTPSVTMLNNERSRRDHTATRFKIAATSTSVVAIAGMTHVSTTGYLSRYAIVSTGNITHDESATSPRAIAIQLKVDRGQNRRPLACDNELLDSGIIGSDIGLTHFS